MVRAKNQSSSLEISDSFFPPVFLLEMFFFFFCIKFLLIFFLSLFLFIFFEVKCVVDRYKWHRPFQMATTVLRNGNDRLRKGNLRHRNRIQAFENALVWRVDRALGQLFGAFHFESN